MADVRIQQALEQMRAMAAQAQGRQTVSAPQDAQGESFGDVLNTALDSVNNLQQDASQKTDAFLRGDDISLTDVMVAGQKSRVAFEAVKEVRNHLLDAYQEVSRMSV
ncbi:MAG TPA: flagellar hook-basal body complex protein FliE [Gammaproteobacteria bacterium]|nr:flagellar hook-basal body complex protein FliE [Gammaproteobacteria bacterium]